MQCPRCQQHNPLLEAQFCPRCGAPIERVEHSGLPGASYADLRQDLTNAREQQTATSEMLQLISSSPTDVQPVFVESKPGAGSTFTLTLPLTIARRHQTRSPRTQRRGRALPLRATGISRRKLVWLLGGATALWPLAGLAQAPSKRPLIAWLSGGTHDGSMGFVAAFLQGMKDLGYVEGRTFEMAYRFSEGFQDRLPALTQEVVKLKPDVILAAAVVAAAAARHATSIIPIVCPALADAVHLGLVVSEARPGKNVTGIEPYVAGLPAKQMQFAREIAPRARKVGILTDLNDPKAPPQLHELQAAGRTVDVNVVVAGAGRPADIEKGLQTLAKQRVDVAIVLQTSMLLSARQAIAESALAKGLPTIYGYREHVLVGGLVSYGVDLRWCFHHGAYFVDRILRGTAPGDLPVEFPTKMVLAVNLKTAKALGLTIPQTLLLQADQVIE